MKSPDECVVIVDENDNPIGIEPKESVHASRTPLHRAFSLFLFNPAGELLLQQRSPWKKAWPLTWSNSCCGHPMPEESYTDAVIRRALYELGVKLTTVNKIADYRYCFSKDGIMENEICPIFSANYSGDITPHPGEVQAVRWIAWNDWLQETTACPACYSPWCIEETALLASSRQFHELHQTI